MFSSDEEESTTSSVMSYQNTDMALNSQIALSPPLMVLNLSAHTGDTNFSVEVPKMCGRNKWIYASNLSKLFAGKNVPFPVTVSFPAGRMYSVVICPVFEATNLRYIPVRRCYNCSSTENSPLSDHLVRVDGSTVCYYRYDDKRPVVEVPLMKQSFEENAMIFLLRMSCRTSCPGGPNRHSFSLLFTLLDENRQQIATDVLHVKCCESPIRDLKHETKIKNETKADEKSNEQIIQIASSLDTKTSKKRKITTEASSDTGTVEISIPKIFEKKVRQYVNVLYRAENTAKSYKYFSTTDTE